MAPSVIDQGIQLMFVGMGTVFLLLAVLVLAIYLMSWAVARFVPPTGEDDELAAAIIGALRFHQSLQRAETRHAGVERRNASTRNDGDRAR